MATDTSLTADDSGRRRTRTHTHSSLLTANWDLKNDAAPFHRHVSSLFRLVVTHIIGREGLRAPAPPPTPSHDTPNPCQSNSSGGGVSPGNR